MSWPPYKRSPPPPLPSVPPGPGADSYERSPATSYIMDLYDQGVPFFNPQQHPHVPVQLGAAWNYPPPPPPHTRPAAVPSGGPHEQFMSGSSSVPPLLHDNSGPSSASPQLQQTPVLSAVPDVACHCPSSCTCLHGAAPPQPAAAPQQAGPSKCAKRKVSLMLKNEKKPRKEHETQNERSERGNRRGELATAEEATKKKKTATLHALNIDAGWLQQQLSKFYDDDMVSQAKAAKVLGVLRSEADDREAENQLVLLLGHHRSDFIKLLKRNRKMIKYSTLLAQSQSESEREDLRSKMREDSTLSRILHQLDTGKEEGEGADAPHGSTSNRPANCPVRGRFSSNAAFEDFWTKMGELEQDMELAEELDMEKKDEEGEGENKSESESECESDSEGDSETESEWKSDIDSEDDYSDGQTEEVLQ